MLFDGLFSYKFSHCGLLQIPSTINVPNIPSKVPKFFTVPKQMFMEYMLITLGTNFTPIFKIPDFRGPFLWASDPKLPLNVLPPLCCSVTS